MWPWLKPVPSIAAALFRIIRSRPGLALVIIGLASLAAVTGLRVLDAHRAGPLPADYQPSPRGFAEERAKLEGMVASRSVVLPSSAPAVNATAPVSEGWGRRIIRHAAFHVELADVDQGVSRLTGMVESAGGFISSTDSQVDQKGTARATITAYVPPAQFARVLGDLDGVGRVTGRQIGGQDVSEEFVDLEARIRNLERHEGQLLSFMGKAQKVQDLLSLENELARVRGVGPRTLERIKPYLRPVPGAGNVAGQ